MTYSQRSIDYPQYGRGGGVARNNDNANALSMLHSSLIDTRNELRSSLTEGFDRLQSAGDGAHRETQDLITTELSKLRTQLRETINRLLTSNTDFAHESRDILALLRQAIRDLNAAGNVPTSEEAPAPEVTADHGAQAEHTDPSAASPANGAVTAEPTADTWTDLEAAAEPVPTLAPTLPSQRAAEQLPASQPSTGPDGAPPTPATPDSSRSPADVAEEAVAGLKAFLQDELASLHADLAERPQDVTATLRAAFQEELAPVRAEVSEAREQLAALRDDLAGLVARLDTPPPVPQEDVESEDQAVEPEPRKPTQDEARQHGELLKRAARISSASLVCHRDIWEFITSQAGRHAHFRMPPQITDRGEDRIAAALSGRSLIAVLICLWDTQHTADEGDADWALATTVYDRIAQGLDKLAAGGATVTITLDDRTHADDTDLADQRGTEPDIPAGNGPDGYDQGTAPASTGPQDTTAEPRDQADGDDRPAPGDPQQ